MSWILKADDEEYNPTALDGTPDTPWVAVPGYDGRLKLDRSKLTQLAPAKTPPLYEHDCQACDYFGTAVFQGENGDVWLHAGTGIDGSLIHRRSSGGPDYWSMPIFGIEWGASSGGRFPKTIDPLMRAVFGPQWMEALIIPGWALEIYRDRLTRQDARRHRQMQGLERGASQGWVTAAEAETPSPKFKVGDYVQLTKDIDMRMPSRPPFDVGGAVIAVFEDGITVMSGTKGQVVRVAEDGWVDVKIDLRNKYVVNIEVAQDALELTPSQKSPGMEKFLDEFSKRNFGVSRQEAKYVTCQSEKVRPEDFKDDLSRKEFNISRMCQKCQNEVFGSGEE